MAKRTGILSRYTTNEKLSIEGSTSGGEAKVVLQSSTVADKVAHRLKQLDDEGNLSPAVSRSVAASPAVGDKTHCLASVNRGTARGPLGVEGMIT